MGPAQNIMNTTKQAEQAAGLLSVLKDALENVQATPVRDSCELEVSRTRKGQWCVGLNVPRRASKKLRKLLRPAWRAAAWIGYQGQENRPAARAIWLYCGKTANLEKVERLMDRK